MNSTYKCKLCGTKRNINHFMAETNLCAKCINHTPFPNYLPPIQWIPYLEKLVNKKNKRSTPKPPKTK